jgi:hypothetical protein
MLVMIALAVAAYVAPCSWYAGWPLASAPLRCVVK